MFDLKRPCKLCPFRKSCSPFLGRARAEEIANQLRSDQTFYCHETVHYDEDHWAEESGQYFAGGDEQHCAGAAMVLLKEGLPNQMMRISFRFGMLDEDQYKGDAFDSLDDFEDHHGSD